MSAASSNVAQFIRAYAAEVEAGRVVESTGYFAETFFAAGSQGSQPVRSTDFALALPKRKQMFDQLGCRATKLVAVEEMRLDSRYVLARTSWQMTVAPEGRETKEVTLHSDYIIDTGTEPWKIVFYLANQDPFAVLKGVSAA